MTAQSQLDLDPIEIRREVLHGQKFFDRLAQLRAQKILVPYITVGKENALWIISYRAPVMRIFAKVPKEVCGYDPECGF